MKKISVNTVKNYMKEHAGTHTFQKAFQIGEESFEVTFKTSLDLSEKTAFISRVMSGCFDALGNYRPEYYYPMFHATLIQMCTNLPVVSMKGQQGDDGEALMDIDGMDKLYHALELNRLDGEGFLDLVTEMDSLCLDALEWRTKRELCDANNMKLKNLADAAITLVEEVANKVREFDPEAVSGYIGEPAKMTGDTEEKS